LFIAEFFGAALTRVNAVRADFSSCVKIQSSARRRRKDSLKLEVGSSEIVLFVT
jgi:hypothetical protein